MGKSFQILFGFSSETHTMIGLAEHENRLVATMVATMVATCKIAPFHSPASIGGLLSVRQEGGLGYLISSVLSLLWGRAGAALDCSHTQLSWAHQWQAGIEVTHFKEFKKSLQPLKIPKKHAHLWIYLCLYLWLYLYCFLFKYTNSCFGGITRWLTTSFG